MTIKDALVALAENFERFIHGEHDCFLIHNNDVFSPEHLVTICDDEVIISSCSVNDLTIMRAVIDTEIARIKRVQGKTN